MTLSPEGKLRFYHSRGPTNDSAADNTVTIILTGTLLLARRWARPSIPFTPPSASKRQTPLLPGKLETEPHQNFPSPPPISGNAQQMKQPSATPRITTLRKLVVNHRNVDFHEHTLHLSKWVRRITLDSPLEHLELAVDGLEYFRGPYLNYRGLVEHVSHKHGGTIRVLRLMHGYIDLATVTLLCQKCSNLEEASFGVNMSTLVGLISNHHPFVKYRAFSIARIPSKGRPVVKVTTGRFSSVQCQTVQGRQGFH